MEGVLFYLTQCSGCNKKGRTLRDVGIEPEDMDKTCPHCNEQVNEVEVDEKTFDAAKK